MISEQKYKEISALEAYDLFELGVRGFEYTRERSRGWFRSNTFGASNAVPLCTRTEAADSTVIYRVPVE